MKEHDVKLTLQETEQLCRLYMDCRLSVLEETELRYFLTQVDCHSPMIDDVRQLMDIDTYISEKPFVKAWFGRKIQLWEWVVNMGIVASVAVLIGIGLSFWWESSHGSVESQSYYIAYVGGHRLSEDAAKLQIEAEKKFADDFIKEMSEQEAREMEMIDNFSTANILEQ